MTGLAPHWNGRYFLRYIEVEQRKWIIIVHTPRMRGFTGAEIGVNTIYSLQYPESYFGQ